MPDLDASAIFAIAAALSLGGLLKGATGMGTPIVAVPVMAAFVDVRLAVIVMVIPNFISNLWQIRQYGQRRLGQGFSTSFAIGGAVGAFVGTLLLVSLPTRALLLIVLCAVVLYIALRLARPDFKLDFAPARKMAFPVAAVAGVLQGAAGISAPVAVSFLNAMRLERPVFIATISLFFVAMSLAQMPTLFGFGLMTRENLLLGCLALVPVFAAMPVGAWAARHMSAALFDKAILILLGFLAIRLCWSVFA